MRETKHNDPIFFISFIGLKKEGTLPTTEVTYRTPGRTEKKNKTVP